MPQRGSRSSAAWNRWALCCTVSLALAGLAVLAVFTTEIKYDVFDLSLPLVQPSGSDSDSDGLERPSLVDFVKQRLPQPGAENPSLPDPILQRGEVFLPRPAPSPAPVAEPLPIVPTAAPDIEAAPIVEAEFPGFELECRNCGECEGDHETLGGEGHSQDVCISACATERACRYVAYDLSRGYCHWFSSSFCPPSRNKRTWIRLRKTSHSQEKEKEKEEVSQDRADRPDRPPVVPEGDTTKWDLFVVIPAASHERERRDAIRATWVNMITSRWCKRCLQSKVTYRFVVGAEGDLAASRQEAAEQGDLGILDDFAQDKTYTKRSEKTFRSIRYAVQHFDFRFLLKCDTDSWVYLDRLLKYFDTQGLWGKDRLYAGNFNMGAGAHAIDKPSAKWYDPVYPKITGFTQYPKHAKGAGYILARSVAEDIGERPLDFWEYVPSEDIAVGFWLTAVRKEVKNIPVEGQANCGSEGTVIDHYIKPQTMRERWRMYEKTGTPCVLRTKR